MRLEILGIIIIKKTAQINKTIPPGKWWRIVKSLAKLNNKHKPPPPLKINGQTLFHPKEKNQSP